MFDPLDKADRWHCLSYFVVSVAVLGLLGFLVWAAMPDF